MEQKLAIREFYNTVLAQAFSPCGNYLVAGDIYGVLSVFHLSKIIKPESPLPKEELSPKVKVTVKADHQINSLLTTKQHLLVGSLGEIYAFSWKNLKSGGKNINPSWTIELPNLKDEFFKAEVNCLLYDEESRHIYAGSGDNNVYVINLETRDILRTLSKHTDYVHCICKNGDRLLSSGEDGIVHFWDLRAYKPVEKIVPHKNNEIARPDLGVWIDAVDCNDDYVLCGGGPRLTLYLSRFLTNALVFPIDNRGIHVADIYQDKVFAGGSSKLFYQANFNGDIITEIPTMGPTTHSVVRQEEPFQVMCIAGSSRNIDVCRNFLYKDLQLTI